MRTMEVTFFVFALLALLAGCVQFSLSNPVAGMGGLIAAGLFSIALAITAKK